MRFKTSLGAAGWGALLLTMASLGLALPARPARACSAFLLKRPGGTLLGKSYDWHTRDGLAVLNPRGQAKRALLLRPGPKPLTWVSRYGSVTFNQYGREFPLGGMNERGLAIEILWLSATRWPTVARRGVPTVNELQWIQYQLDTAASVPELLRAARRIQIQKAYADVHYFACDAAGRCAVVEHLGGRQVVHHGRGLPVKVITNDPYAPSLAYLRRHRGFGGRRALPAGSGSLARFVRAAAGVARFARPKRRRTRIGAGAKAAVAEAFALLDRVRSGSYTQWQIVYDLRARRVAFRTSKAARTTHISLAGLGRRLSCKQPVRILDPVGTVAPSLARRFGPYSTAINERLVRRTTARLRGGLPAPLVSAIARYPVLATRCKRP